VPQRFMSIREIRFTVALREAITIAATSAPGCAQFHAPRRRDNHRRFQKGRFSAQHCCRRAHRAGQLADRSRENIPGLNGRGECEQQCDWEMKKPGTSPGSRWNEGVGEHVRTRSRPGFGPGEIAEPLDPQRTKKTCFFCRTGFRES